MLRKFIYSVLLMALMVSLSYAGTIKGIVKDQETNQVMAGANVFLKGSSYGSSTTTMGEYTIKDVPPGNYTLVVTYIGYAQYQQDINLNDDAVISVDIGLTRTFLYSEQVVVTASRAAEKITEAPATINIINARQIAEHPSANIGELLAYEKGVDYVRSGVVGTGVNIRGFNSAFNIKNLQMNDNRLSTLIGTSLPFAALSTTVKDDIERIEVILGPNAALYGPNAHNGLVSTITKDPRTSQETSVVVGGGSRETIGSRFRHAKAINEKFAYKVTGEYARGEEYNFADTVYVITPARVFALKEEGLDLDFDSIRGEAAFYYTPKSNHDIILSYGGSNSNNLGVTNAGRNQIIDWQIHYLHARYQSPRIFAQVYYTWSKTEDTFALNQRTQNFPYLPRSHQCRYDHGRRSFEAIVSHRLVSRTESRY